MLLFGHKRKLVSFGRKLILIFCFILIFSQGSPARAATLGDFFSDGLNSYTLVLAEVKGAATFKAAGILDTLKDGFGVARDYVVSRLPSTKKQESPASAPAVSAPAPKLPSVKIEDPQLKPAAQTAPVKKLIIVAPSAKPEPKEEPLDTPTAKVLKSDIGFFVDALTGIVTLKGLRVAGLVDFTGADIKGLPAVAAVPSAPSANPTAPPPLSNVSNTFISASPVSVQPVVGTIGGVSTDFSVGRNLTVSSNAFVDSTLTVGTATTNGALTVNGSAAISTTLGVTGATTLTGALTANGGATLGDSSGDNIIVIGRLSTLNISDGSTTSSLAKNSFYIAADSSNALGKFYVDSSGNTSVSGTFTAFGNLTLSGHLYPSSDNTYDVGSSSTQWRYGNFQGGLLVADGTTTSTLSNNSLILGQTSGSNLGKFYVDSSGNVSVSGSLLTYGNVTSTGIFYAANGLIANASSTFASNLSVSGDLKTSSTLQTTGDLTIYGNTTLGDVAGDTITVNGRLSTLNISDGSTTSSLAKNSFYIAADSSNALGKFYVDSSGNITSSGTLAITGHFTPYTDNTYDIGSSSTQWRYGNFQGGLLVADGTTTSTLSNNSLILGQTSGSNLGKFYVDSSGNTSASGNGSFYGKVGAGGAFNASYSLYVTGQTYSSSGYNSGSSYQYGSQNVLAFSSTDLQIGNVAFWTTASLYGGTTRALTAIPGGKVGIGTTSPADKLTISDGNLSITNSSVTSTLGANFFAIATSTTDMQGKFYVDSSGNITSSGTLAITGNFTPYTDNTYDIGSSSTQWRYGNFQGGLLVADGTTTSTLSNNSLILGQTSGSNLGKFYVDSSGNTNTSGTLRVYGGASTGGLLISSTNTTTTLTSYVSGNGVGAFVLDTNTLFTPASSTVLLSVRNAGNKVFSISNDGYVASTGTFNANVASTGIGDVAEYINLIAGESVEPGDVLVVSKDTPNKYKKSTAAYTKEIAGVVSDTGAFIIGASGDGRAPLALAGLVKVKVSVENGHISVGDYLVSSAKPGYAMKYNSDNPQSAGLVGMALEPTTEDGRITIMVNKGLLDGAAVTNLNVTENVQGQLVQNGDMDVAGHGILNIKVITGVDNKWQIGEDGKFIRRITTSKGDKEIYGLGSASGDEIVLSGSSQLENGQKRIMFEEIDQEIIARDAPLKIFVTLSGESVGIFTAERSYQGFLVKELNGGAGNATFDWVVMTKKKSDAQTDVQAPPPVSQVNEQPVPQEEPKQEESKKEEKDDKKNEAEFVEALNQPVIPSQTEESSPVIVSDLAQ